LKQPADIQRTLAGKEGKDVQRKSGGELTERCGGEAGRKVQGRV